MTPSDALILITEIKSTPYGTRIMRMSTKEWDFVNSIDHLAKLGKTLSNKQGWRLSELYRKSQGHGHKRYSRVEKI